MDIGAEYEVPIEVLLKDNGWEYTDISDRTNWGTYPFYYCQTKAWIKDGIDKDQYHYEITYFQKGSLVKDYSYSKLKRLRKPLIVTACRIKYSNGDGDKDPQYAREYRCWRMHEYDVFKLVKLIESADLKPNTFKCLGTSISW